MRTAPQSPRLRPLLAASLVTLTATLVACGSSSDSPSPTPPPPPPPPPAPVTVSVNVIDGLLRNARVCMDVNGNGECDSTEPASVSSAAGVATLQVPADLVGRHPLVAVVGTDAVDADSGPVTQAYTMTTPADRTAVISPLTTLAQFLVQTQNLTSAEADTQLQAAGLAVSAYDNFVARRGTEPASAEAGLVAAAVAAALAQQTAAVASAIGKADAGGTTVTRADVERLVRGATLLALQEVVSAINAPAARDACAGGPAAAGCQAQLAAASTAVVQAAGLTEAGVLALAAVARNRDRNESTAGVAGAQFRWLNYGGTPSADYYYRVNLANAQEDTAVNGQKKYRILRRERLAGTTREWFFARDYERRNDAHWNGTAWVACPDATFQHTASVRDANGRATYNLCDSREIGYSIRSSESIAGKTLAEVVKRIRAFPGAEGGVSYARWGDPLSGAPLTNAQIDTLFGSTQFPANSELTFQTPTSTAFAVGYDVRDSNRVLLFSPEVAAGGDARVNPNVPCNQPGLTSSLVTRLEDLFIMRGTPCQFAPAAATADYLGSGPVNESWGPTSISLGTIGNVPLGNAGLPLPAPYATGNRVMRVAFTGTTADRKTSYYRCEQRRRDGSTRNCVKIGEGTYEIATLGDARAMSFRNVPTENAALTFDRVFVERGGAVYFGYRDKPTTFAPQIRLNLPAANAVLQQVGLPVIVP
jgi:hypothetical protein